ncbi:MAG: TIGR04283 family arsenosugar biosynthesis glycosyltransferase [Dehalococcoidia bacterium]|nr:TIGR04283 family arsenosugar biosynthesis glycosyltransferase [Dehalococcoidia bacterium]
MKLSIVIPVLNEASTISSSLQKVLSLNGDFEVIVVDGGSEDGTQAIVESIARPRHTLRLLASPRGRAAQMNLGAEDATGDVLLFLHADTTLPEGAVRAIEVCLAQRAVVGGRFRVRLDMQGWRFRMISSSINLRDRVFRGFTGDQAIFIRTGVFRTLGGFADMPLMEDLDLAKRMCRAGNVVRLPMHVVTSARRWHEDGVFRTITLMWRLRLLYELGYPPAKLKRLYGETR